MRGRKKGRKSEKWTESLHIAYKEEALYGLKWAGKQPAQLYMLRVKLIDRFINNESGKTGKINSVNKCAVSSSAPVPNGLCLCTSLLQCVLCMCVSVRVHSFKQWGSPRCHGNNLPEPHYWCCVMMMMRDSFILPHRKTHRYMCASLCLPVS